MKVYILVLVVALMVLGLVWNGLKVLFGIVPLIVLGGLCYLVLKSIKELLEFDFE